MSPLSSQNENRTIKVPSHFCHWKKYAMVLNTFNMNTANTLKVGEKQGLPLLPVLSNIAAVIIFTNTTQSSSLNVVIVIINAKQLLFFILLIALCKARKSSVIIMSALGVNFHARSARASHVHRAFVRLFCSLSSVPRCSMFYFFYFICRSSVAHWRGWIPLVSTNDICSSGKPLYEISRALHHIFLWYSKPPPPGQQRLIFRPSAISEVLLTFLRTILV